MTHARPVGDQVARIGASRAGKDRQWNARRRVLVTSSVHVIGCLCAVVLTPAQAAAFARASGGPAVLARDGPQRAHDGPARDTLKAGSIVGTVRSGPLVGPLLDARIEVEYGADSASANASASTQSDTGGAYEITGLAGGTVMMYVTHPGYDSVALQVTVPTRGAVRINVTLQWTPVVLDSIRVHGAVASNVAASRSSIPVGGPSEWRWTGNPADAITSTGDPDAFRLLEGDTHVAMGPESHALMDLGGTSDQLLVRVDGLPVWSPVHASGAGALSALSPNVVASMTLHDAVMPAAAGDRLAGVLDVDTRDPLITRSAADVALGPAAARAMWARSFNLAGATGGVLIAGRMSDADFSSAPTDVGALHDRWADGVATGSLRFAASTLRLVAMSSGDRAVAEDELTPDSSSAKRPSVPWHTRTVGLVWDQQLAHAALLEMRVSQADFGATVPTLADSGGPTIRSSAQQSEVSTQLSRAGTTIGANINVLALGYHVTEPAGALPVSALALAGASRTADGLPLWLGNNAMLAAGFVTHTWGPADSGWHVTTGLRASEINGAMPRADPRLDAAVRLTSGLTASIGLGRSHQYVQSLRNTNAPGGAELGIDLPVAAGMDRVPVAQSDAGTVALAAQLGPFARLTVDGYLRQMSGLAVVSPLSQSAFAIHGFERATARVRGLGAELNGRYDRLTWQAVYDLGTTIDHFAALTYHPTTQLGQTATLAAGLRLDRAMQLRVATWLAAGQPAPRLNADPAGRDADDANAAAGVIDRDADADWMRTSPLPTYLRTDLELLRAWPLGRTGSSLSTYFTLANVLNHANVTMFIPRAAGAPATPVLLLPRSLLVGVTWSY